MQRLKNFSRGKIRNSGVLEDGTRIIHTTDRISAFDSVLPLSIPGKGSLLQAMSVYFFNATAHIIENHFIGTLSDEHMLVKNADVFPLEIVVRGFLTGSLWREYEARGPEGVFAFYGVKVPYGMKRNQAFPHPIITPTSKAVVGHDMPVSIDACSQILETFFKKTYPHSSTFCAPDFAHKTWETVKVTAQRLFRSGQELARSRNLELVDTKYEMGFFDGKVILVDEVHTPDSSRYWYYEDLFSAKPRQLSKEFLREEILDIMGSGVTEEGLADHPKFKDSEFVGSLTEKISSRYHEVFQQLIPPMKQSDVSKKAHIPWPLDPLVFSEIEQDSQLPHTIFVAGNGGRDKALFEMFRKRPEVKEIYCAPGQRAWGEKYVDCTVTSIREMAQMAAQRGAGLAVAGPEMPIAQGFEQAMREQGIPVIAPDIAGASLEASKIFCKEVAIAADLLVPKGEVMSWPELKTWLSNILEETNNFAASQSLPRVIKYDGLAAGKGVFVLKDAKDIQYALDMIEENLPNWESINSELLTRSYSKQMGFPGFLVEECIFGTELSVIALCNGTDFRLLPVARDYKRRNDGDSGPNTGGMGSVAPVKISEGLLHQVRTVFEKTLKEMAQRGSPYHGFLFAGFMQDAQEKLWLLEFNCRLGDPESQVILPGLGQEFFVELSRTSMKKPFAFQQRSGQFFEHDGKARIFVVGVSPEYPDKPLVGRKLDFYEKPGSPETSGTVFYPSAITPEGMTAGGRAFGILGTADDLALASESVYEAMLRVTLEETTATGRVTLMSPHYRKDIGAEFLEKTALTGDKHSGARSLHQESAL